MSVINTNINALTGLTNLRKTNLGIRNSLEKLSSGYAINKAADNPSGLAISLGMHAQTRGIKVAIQNAEDTINLIQTADGAMHESGEIAQRMRDIAVRGANQGAINTNDQQKLYLEFMSLAAEMYRKADAVTYNTKNLLNNTDFDPLVTGPQVSQIGADDGMAYRVELEIQSIVYFQAPMGGATLDISSFVDPVAIIDPGGSYVPQDGAGMQFLGNNPPDITTGFQNLIDFSDAIIGEVARIRAALGVKQRRLEHIINDLSVQDINISASRSRIIDANMAVEISDFTKAQILQQSGTAILAQANAQPQSVLQLLQ